MTITLGWWLAPAIITLAAFIWARWEAPNLGTELGIPDIADVFLYAVATGVSLAAWLAWAVLA